MPGQSRQIGARIRLQEWLPAVALGIALLLGGGGSPAPGLELATELLVATILAAWVLTLDLPLHAAIPRGAWVLAGLIVVLPLVQLVPLPPAVWQALPGRGIEREALALIGAEQSWRSWSIAPERTLAALLAAVPPLAILGMTAASDRAVRLRIVAVVGAVTGLTLVLGALQLSGGPGSPFRFLSPQSGGLDGFQANRNSTADLLLVGLVATAAVLREGVARRIALPLFGAAALLIGLGVVLTASRTGIVLLPLALLSALVALESWVRLPFKTMAAIVLALAVLGGIAAVQLSNNAALARVAARFDSRQELRPDLWRDAAHVAREHLPFGVGMGNLVPAMVAAERLEIVRPTMPNRAHNELLELAVEGGIFALGLAATGLGLLARSARRAWADPPEQARGLVVFGIGGLVLLLLHSLVDYPFRSMALACLGAACAGMFLHRRRGRPPRGEPGQPEDAL
jgi:O-antigen ligase